MIQVITVPDEEFEAYRTTVDFIQRYIFGRHAFMPGANGIK